MAKDKRIGNKFWQLRSKHGRDRLFSSAEELKTAAEEYFTWCEDNPLTKAEALKSGERAGDIVYVPIPRPYTMQGLCGYLGCNIAYFSHFESSIKDKVDEVSKDFSNVITYIREVIYRQKFEGATAGYYNSNIIARDLGLTDKQDLNLDANVNAKINNTVDYSKLSDETLQELLKHSQKSE